MQIWLWDWGGGLGSGPPQPFVCNVKKTIKENGNGKNNTSLANSLIDHFYSSIHLLQRSRIR